MFKKLLFIVCLMVFTLCSFAQKTVKGKVTDENDNPLKGVTVITITFLHLPAA